MPKKSKRKLIIAALLKNYLCCIGFIAIIVIVTVAVVPRFAPADSIFGDFDGDGLPNWLDPDDDGDGIPDVIDPFPRGGGEGGELDDTTNLVTYRIHVQAWDDGVPDEPFAGVSKGLPSEDYTSEPGNPFSIEAIDHLYETAVWYDSVAEEDGPFMYTKSSSARAGAYDPPYLWDVVFIRKADGGVISEDDFIVWVFSGEMGEDFEGYIYELTTDTWAAWDGTWPAEACVWEDVWGDDPDEMTGNDYDDTVDITGITSGTYVYAIGLCTNFMGGWWIHVISIRVSG